ncbi:PLASMODESMATA CALLOSE-BINDING PROTEIN 2-like [Henckelia pumila]|uniref:PLASMODESMATA CALLOSE-BINDING PROTEIN 2-like n=1 Tax=Henckelia pumila TaxID=405737 RepID=UPI003C6E50BC
MALVLISLVLLPAMAGVSDAAYCICSNGGDGAFQKNIDYACGAGADCSPILQNGACYNPNTVKDHCNYAVNSYYQRKGQVVGSCDFAGTATVAPTSPSAVSGCVYPSSASNVGSTTPSTNPTVGGTTTPNTGGIGNTTGTMPGSTVTPGIIGLAPSGGTGFSDTSRASVTPPLSSRSTTTIFVLLSLTLLLSGSTAPRI